MAGNVKGITIEFRGDTTKLDKALRDIKNSTKDLDRELKSVDKALKFNPTSVELWRQKQDLLKAKIKETEKGLKELKDIQSQMDAKGVDKQSEAYRKVQREIIEAESKLKTFNSQLRKIGQVNLRAMSEQFKKLGQNLESAGQSMRGISTAAAAVTAAIGALTVKSGQWADDMNTMSKVYGIGTNELQQYAAAADLVDVSVETIAKSHLRLTKAMSGAEDDTGAQAEAFERLGISVTDANGNLRDADTVWQETIKALGEVENETEREALAMTLMGKSAAELNPLIEDGGETYQRLAETMAKYDLDFIDQEMLDNANAFNDSLDTIKAVGLVAFQQLGTQLAAYLAPAMEKVVDLVGRLASWFSKLSPRTQTLIAGIAAVVAVIAPLLIGLGKVSFAISSIIKLVAVVGPAIGGIVAALGPAIGGIVAALGPVILIIGAVVAAGVLLYKNWDKIKAKAIDLKNKLISTFNNIKARAVAIWNSLKSIIQNIFASMVGNVVARAYAIKNTVTTIFNSIKEAITNPIQTAVGLVQAAIEKIKSIINGAHLSLPHFKLPHFRVYGGALPWGIGGKGTPPKISVDWYAQGGIFDRASIIGVGEAGPEAVVPLDKFWEKLDQMQMGTSIVININGANRDPRDIAEEVRRVLIKETNQRRLAWQ